MGKIYITAGHEVNNGKGTGAHGFIDEAAEARRVTSAISKYLSDKYKVKVITDPDNWKLLQIISWLGGLVTFNDITIDVHFNAGPATATGAEVFIPKNSTQKEKDFAKEMLDAMTKELKIKSRGVKTEDQSQHKRLGILSGKSHIATNILLEICFVSNRSDCYNYNSNFDKLIEGLSEVIYKYSK